MNKIFSSPILKIILIVMLIPALMVNFLMAYIIFAPNSFPKPFHLVYEYPGITEAAAESAQIDGEYANGDMEPQPAVSEPGLHIPEPGHGIMFDTGTKIINLAEPTGRRYIRVNIVLEFMPTNPDYQSLEHEEQNHYLEEFNHEIEEKLPIINDSLISMLSSKTFEEVYTADGKELIREELVTLLNERMPDHLIMNVYFTEFVVQ